MSWQACGLVLAGGFLGGILRVFVSSVVQCRRGDTFPWGTLVVNVSGALAIGALAGAARASGGLFAEPLVRDFAIIGALGGYTTVSSFSLQTVNLALTGQQTQAWLNIVLSTSLCLVAVGLGFWPATRLFG